MSMPAAVKRRAVRPELEPLGAHLGLRTQSERDERRAMGGLELVREPSAVRVADVHGRRRGGHAREQPPLRLEVLLHVAVEVEMLLGEVREDERVEAHAIEPPEVRAVRGRLDHDGVVAGVEHVAEEPLQVDRLRGRVGRVARLAADDPLHGADEPGGVALGLQDRAEEVRGR